MLRNYKFKKKHKIVFLHVFFRLVLISTCITFPFAIIFIEMEMFRRKLMVEKTIQSPTCCVVNELKVVAEDSAAV